MLQQAKNTKGIIPFSNGPVLQEGENNFKNFTTKMEDGNLVISSKFDKKKVLTPLNGQFIHLAG
ncbi:hypothetical protein [Pedobacter sp. P26]|uniref:hypothetical protein n=1 Tax=Pedobacter sp. P26 TaxID=3423956 RepID=UPI003D67B0F6